MQDSIGVGGSFLRIRNATLKFVGSSNTVREDGSILLQFSELGKMQAFPPRSLLIGTGPSPT